MLVLVLALSLLAGKEKDDLGYLAKVPNVKLEGEAYTYTGDPDHVMMAVLDALAQHGWSPGVTLLAGELRAGKAYKGREQLLIILGPKGFSVSRSAHDGGVPSTPPSIGIYDDKAKKTLDCSGKAVGVRASGTELTLSGKCGQLSVNGSGNTVKVTGTVEAVLVTGSNNKVALPAGAQPTVADLGTGNTVGR